MLTSKFSPNISLGKFFPNGGELHGTIGALAMGSISVMSQQTIDREGRPYLKLIGDPLGNAYEIGAAFPKEKDGKVYYSVTLESPLFPAPVRAALFQDHDNTALYNLVWNRPETPKLSADATLTAVQVKQRRYIGPSSTP